MKIEKKIKKIIKSSDNIFICSHKDLDLDAIGSCIGLSSISKHFNKDNYIIVDDKVHEIGVGKVLKEYSNKNIITSEEIPNLFKKNSILIIPDVSKAHLLQNPKILHNFKNIIILDHHQITDQTIEAINLISEKYSSACEIVTNLIKEYKVKLTKEEATIILSGIVLDTNNFQVKTSSNTYYSAYYLTTFGADSKKVKYYLKENINDYIIRNKVIMNTEILLNKYAIAKAPKDKKYKREELAKLADTLLTFNDIDASFIVANRIDDGVGISARSEGKVDVGLITSQLGGGGDINSAACHILDMDIESVYNELKTILNKEE